MSETNETKTVTYDEVEYTISTKPLDDVDALEGLEDNNWTILARAILGRAQWLKFKSKKRTQSELLELITVLLGGDDKEDAPTE